MANGFEDLGAVTVKPNDFSDLGGIPVSQRRSPVIQRVLNPVPEEFRQQQILLNEPSLMGAGRRFATPIVGGVETLGSMLSKSYDEVGNLINQGQTDLSGALGSAIKTALETGSRVVGDPTTMIASKIEEYKNNPSSLLEDALRSVVAPFPTVGALFPSGTSQKDLESELKKSQLSQELNKERARGYTSNIPGINSLPGQVQSNVADIGLMLAPGATKAGRAQLRTLRPSTPNGIFTNLAENRAPATLSQVAESALDFTPEQVAQSVPTAVQRVRQVVGKETPTTAREGISALDKTEKEILNQRLDINEAADNRGLIVNGNQALDSARSVLDEIKIITNAEKDKILKKAEELYSGERPPTDGQLVQMQLNEKLKGFYNAEDPVESAQLLVDKAIRDSYANQMDEISQIMTGRAESPYSDIGAIIETRNALRKMLERVEGSEADKKTGLKRGASKIPLSKTGVVAKSADTVLSKVQKNQLRKLNEATQRIFSEGEASIVSPEIPVQTLEELLSSKTRTGTKPQPIRF